MSIRPPVECLEECFSYEQGLLRWKKRPPHHFATKTGCAIFNGKFEGRVATHVGSDGYPRVKFRIDGVLYRVMQSHVVLAMHEGTWPPEEVDHKNCNKLDRGVENLRRATRIQNLCNKGVRRDNKTGAKGVRARRGGFHARITLHGQKFHLGDFKTLDEAAAAYKKAACELHGEFARFEK